MNFLEGWSVAQGTTDYILVAIQIQEFFRGFPLSPLHLLLRFLQTAKNKTCKSSAEVCTL